MFEVSSIQLLNNFLAKLLMIDAVNRVASLASLEVMLGCKKDGLCYLKVKSVDMLRSEIFADSIYFFTHLQSYHFIVFFPSLIV